MHRREILALFAAGGAVAAAPAAACRSPRAKSRDDYTRVIRTLFAAWWRRDYRAFSEHFRHRDVRQPFNGRRVFNEYFDQDQPRHTGDILFNGPSAVIQVVTPRGPDAAHGICGGYAWADLVLIKFFPGLVEPVVAEVRYVGGDALAAEEWRSAEGPPPVG
jgi:hypothetical protein